jgi:chaperonin cofactor prefoldin
MEASTKTIHDVKETLNEYFKLKLQYETQIMANKKKIMNNSTLSNREKRAEFLKLKPKCINCKRPGGTRFKTSFFKETDNEESYRQYKATCGIIADPCNLDITVQIGKVDLLPNLLNNIQNEINERKNTVINDKNKLLFGCITTEDALARFETLKDDISFYTSFYEIYLETYNAIVDNDKIKTELNTALSDYYVQIDRIKDCIKKMNETGNVQYAHDAVVIQTTILTPLMDKLRSLKYNETTVLRNEDANTCNLIQTIYSIQKLSYSSFTDKVVSYNVGTEVIFKKKTALIASESEEEEHTLEEEPNLIKKPSRSVTAEDKSA